jgi:cilia- and flagella-associated protein 57
VVLCYWQYDKTKNISIKISQSQILATELAFNPNDTSFISICGFKVFKTYRLTENTEDSTNKTNILKPLNQQIAGTPTDLSNNYSCHCWLTVDSKIIVGTEGGEIICLNNFGEFEEVLKNSPASLLKNNWNVHCITPFSKGFILGGESCMVFIYKYFEDMDGMKKWEVTHQMQVKIFILEMLNKILGKTIN